MERLTKRLHDGKVVTDCDSCEQKKDKQCTLSECRASLIKRLAAYEDIAEPCGGIDSLRELAEADKDRRLVMLPCKVGDTVYFALIGRIIEKQVFSIVSFSNSTRIYCGGTSEYFRPEDIGKTVFLTREEAEKALRGMEGKKDG